MGEYTKETIQRVADNDVTEVWRKDVSYNRSWKKRGGIGAFLMLARKWDRLEEFMLQCPHQYDLFESIVRSGGDGVDGTTLAEVRDLRRYLLLVEAEMIAKGVVPDVRHVPQEKAVEELANKTVNAAGMPPLASIPLKQTRSTGMDHPFGYDRERDEV